MNYRGNNDREGDVIANVSIDKMSELACVASVSVGAKKDRETGFSVFCPR